MFNGRRGGEPARLLMTDFEEAISDTWIDPNFLKTVDELYKAFIEHLKVTYQSGKGNRLAPLLYPKDVIEPMKLLINEELRTKSGVSKANTYVFASIKFFEKHISGWNYIQSLCSELKQDLTSKITATQNRHRMSTLYESLEMGPQEKKLFSVIWDTLNP